MSAILHHVAKYGSRQMAGLMERIGATKGGVLDDYVYIQGSLRLDTEEAPPVGVNANLVEKWREGVLPSGVIRDQESRLSVLV